MDGESMRFAYADPPYLGCGRLYAKHHPEALIWDEVSEHRALVERLCDDYKDGWALSLHEPSLRDYLKFIPNDARIASWVKPFAAFKKGVTRAYTWEPVIFWHGRKIPTTSPTWRDHISEPITMKKGLTGAKPHKFNLWVLAGLGFQRGDTLDDLFPGTNGMAAAVAEMCRSEPQFEMGMFTQPQQGER